MTDQLPASNPEIRTALAALGAISRGDLFEIMILGKYNDDPNALVWGFAQLVIDALAQPASTDLAAYVDHAFTRLEVRS